MGAALFYLLRGPSFLHNIKWLSFNSMIFSNSKYFSGQGRSFPLFFFLPILLQIILIFHATTFARISQIPTKSRFAVTGKYVLLVLIYLYGWTPFRCQRSRPWRRFPPQSCVCYAKGNNPPHHTTIETNPRHPYQYGLQLARWKSTDYWQRYHTRI